MSEIKIPLQEGLVVLIDSQDYDLVSRYEWRAMTNQSGNVYATTKKVRENDKPYLLGMHRLIMAESDSSVLIDHINHNSLDNRRSNLRRATQRQNQQNQKPRDKASSFKGVSPYRHSRLHPWRAQIRTEKKRIHLGIYSTEIEAAIAYDNAAIEYHGEFALLNFPLAKAA